MKGTAASKSGTDCSDTSDPVASDSGTCDSATLAPGAFHLPTLNRPTDDSASVPEAAFAEVFQAQFLPLVRLATATVDQRSVAEDIVQDAFGQLWERWETVKSPAPYVRTTVVHGCMQELRRRRVRRKHDVPERPIGLADEHHFMLDTLAGLSIRRRTALVLRFYGGMTMTEIAEAMDIRPGTAKSLISRGLQDLRNVVEK